MDDILTIADLKHLLNAERYATEFKKFVSAPIKEIRELSEGNVNQVFRVILKNDKSFIIKYAPPFAYRYRQLAIANERNIFETTVLKKFSEHSSHYPKIYCSLNSEHMTFMEDLKDCSIMRDALIKGMVFPKFADHVIEIFSTYLHNKPKSNKLSIPFSYENGIPELQNITKLFVFENPFGENYPNNISCLPANQDWIKEHVFENLKLQTNRKKLQEHYYLSNEALLHGDLHTGSIMLNPEKTYLIDPEFAKLGPISFDLGMLLANLLMSLVSCEYHLRNNFVLKNTFKVWLIQTIENIWSKVFSVFEENGKDIRKMRQEVIGYCGIEIIRRIIGEAQIKEFLSIDNELTRIEIEKEALAMAVEQIMKFEDENTFQRSINRVYEFNLYGV